MERRATRFPRLGHSLWRALTLLRRPNHANNAPSATATPAKAKAEAAGRPPLVAKAGRKIFSTVKKLLGRVETNKGICNVKDFLLGGYQRLPKTSSFRLCSSRSSSRSFYRDANWNFQTDDDSISSDFSASCRHPADFNAKARHPADLNTNSRHPATARTPKSDAGTAIVGVVKHTQNLNKQKKAFSGQQKRVFGEKTRLKTKKKIEETLREFAMRNNCMEDTLDIDEFLHFYSRISCPFYVDIVNQFVVDLLGETLESN